MQEQHERPMTTPQEEPTQTTSRQPWQRPTLQRLHVSLDTTKSTGSGSDGGSATK
ncbi:hypothetical protein [Candidatus Chloroploca sp. Khr17]|uniref:hypothetical protein n=1 Tax=Candidatus Chloroploca sp. Khr17 TaxID=2496869 RepID=UPI0013EB341E|nr:hypothetical protein [Candidatus Chloroploca sp. Khr17]